MPPPIQPSRSRSLRRNNANNNVAPNKSNAKNISSTANVINSTNKSTKSEPPTSLDISPSRLPIKSLDNLPRPRSSTEIPHQSRFVRKSSISAAPTHQIPPQTSGLEYANINNQSRTQSVTLRRNTGSHQRAGPRPISMISTQQLQNVSALNSATTHTGSSSHSRTQSVSTIRNQPSSSRPSTSYEYSTIAAATHSQALRPVSVIQPKKPLFSTHQQHYSPAKNLGPKLHPSEILAPPTPSKWPANKALSAETVKLQNELLQLHLLHNDVGRIEKEWRASAHKKLASRFHNLVEKKCQVRQLELQDNAKNNALALKKWLDVGAQGWGLDEKLQVLDEITNGIFVLLEAEGRYTRVIHSFEKWVEECQAIWDNRACLDETVDEASVVLAELDSTWKDDCFSLRRKLEVWKERSVDLGVPDVNSSLGTVIMQIQRIVTGMISEIRLISRIEEEVVNMEYDWILHQNGQNAVDEDAVDNTPATAGAIWRKS